MAKKKKFVIGDRIGQVESLDENGKLRYHPDDEACFGTITDVLANGQVMVKWDDSWMSSNYPVDTSELHGEDALKEKLSALEVAFKKVQDEVKNKMKDAAKAILDAQKVARAAGFDLNELEDAIAPLEGAMDKCGWQTSSWYC